MERGWQRKADRDRERNRDMKYLLNRSPDLRQAGAKVPGGDGQGAGGIEALAAHVAREV